MYMSEKPISARLMIGFMGERVSVKIGTCVGICTIARANNLRWVTDNVKNINHHSETKIYIEFVIFGQLSNVPDCLPRIIATHKTWWEEIAMSACQSRSITAIVCLYLQADGHQEFHPTCTTHAYVFIFFSMSAFILVEKLPSRYRA